MNNREFIKLAPLLDFHQHPPSIWLQQRESEMKRNRSQEGMNPVKCKPNVVGTKSLVTHSQIQIRVTKIDRIEENTSTFHNGKYTIHRLL